MHHKCRPSQFNCQKPITRELREQTGFSLIELLVVLSILAILTTIGLVSFLNYNRAQALTTASRDLRNNLRFAQSKAIVGEKPAGCTTLSGYSLGFIANNEYAIYAICNSSLDFKTVAKFKMPRGIRQTAGSLVTFKIISGATSIMMGGVLFESDITITLTSDYGGTENITVTQNGVIQ